MGGVMMRGFAALSLCFVLISCAGEKSNHSPPPLFYSSANDPVPVGMTYPDFRSMTKEEMAMEEAQKLFLAMDTNNNGLLSDDEYSVLTPMAGGDQ